MRNAGSNRLALGLPEPKQPSRTVALRAKELAHRFIVAQAANWRNPKITVRCYRDWLHRFLDDHAGFNLPADTMYALGEDTGLLEQNPRLKRAKNESLARANLQEQGALHGRRASIRSCSTAVPMTSDWGLAVMTMLLLAAGTVVFHQRMSPIRT